MPKGYKKDGSYAGVVFQNGKDNPNWKGGTCDNIKEYKKKYRQKHIEKIREYKREYMKKRRQENSKHRLNHNISGAIYKALKRNKMGGHWEILVGYTLQDLMKHLENLFDKNMNWENYGSYWHIDHKCPQSWFKYETVEDKDFRNCWALENLQPLWAHDNLVKHAKYPDFKVT